MFSPIPTLHENTLKIVAALTRVPGATNQGIVIFLRSHLFEKGSTLVYPCSWSCSWYRS
jgi:hypothetical protein